MRPALAVTALLFLAACARPGGGAALPSDALDHFIGDAIGDPATCVILADRPGGKILYRYGERFNCERPLPACDRAGTLSAQSALTLAKTPGGRQASCPSTPDGSRTVGWAQGRTQNTRRDLLYSVVMEGERALPGQEIASRLADALQTAGL